MTNQVLPVEEQLMHRISSLILDDPDLHAWARERALEMSGTKRWTQAQWERSGPAQSTYQYTLYYAELTRSKAMIVTRALNQLLGI